MKRRFVMEEKKVRKPPPVWLLLIIFSALYTSISIWLTNILQLPWIFPLHQLVGMVVGVILLVAGFLIWVSAMKTLKLRRAFGKDIYKPEGSSRLITTGIYASVRNPIYLGVSVMLLGWFFVFQLTFFLILTILFLIHFYFVAKWEERELTRRFGDEYLRYKSEVGFFIPHFRKQK